MQQWTLQTSIIQYRSSGGLTSLVNFQLINQFSLNDDLTFNSGTAGAKWLESSDSHPALQHGLCSTLLCLVSVVTCGSAWRLHNPFNLFMCTAESVDTHFPHEAWKSHQPWLNRPAWSLFPLRDFLFFFVHIQNNEYQLNVYITRNSWRCSWRSFPTFSLAIRTSFFLCRLWISCLVKLYRTQIALISSVTLCCVLIWALTAVFIGQKETFFNWRAGASCLRGNCMN